MSTPRHPVIPIVADDEPARRRFLKIMAASAALAGAGCSGPPGETIVPYVRMPEQGVPGLPLFYATAFVRRGYAHGVLVETNMGRPTKIEGNPDHPVSAGATDVFAQASILQLWDPDRSQTVQKGEQLSTWQAFEAALEARRPFFSRDGGAGLRILTGEVTSPTLASQLDAVMARYPNARWHAYDPLHDDGAAVATTLAFGRPLDALYRLERVSALLTLDADLFGAGPASVAHARAFITPRRLGANPGANHLFALESTPTLTGAYADARLARPPHAIEAALWRIAGLLGAAPGGGSAPDAPSARWEAQAAQALRGAQAAAKGSALVVAGAGLSPAARALVCLLNQQLGAHGRGAVVYVEPVARSAPAHGDAIAELAGAMHAGEVDTLLMLDTNPVYSAPPELGFAQALRRVPCSAHLGLYHDETGRLATWHLPLAHNYEAWSDARAHDGTATIVQPMIAPLYGGRSVHEVLAMVPGMSPGLEPGQEQRAPKQGQRQAQDRGQRQEQRQGQRLETGRGPGQRDEQRLAQDSAGIRASRDGHALVRATWQDWLSSQPSQSSQPTSDFDTFWREALRSGIVPGSAAQAAAVRNVSPVTRPPAVAAPPLVVTFAPDPAADDGGFCNNAWLQELPRPLTSLTWDNAALIGPATAASAGLADGDVAHLTVEGRMLLAPVLVLPEQAEGVVTLPLGYGRSGAGVVGNTVGFDAYRLRTRAAMAGPMPLQLARTGRRHTFALRQREVDMHGRAPVRTPAPGARPIREEARISLYPGRAYDDYKWGMAIDLNACIGCGACTLACQAENNIPVVGKEEVIKGRSMHWIRVDRYRSGPRTLFQPVPCMHCEHAPCEEVCPVGATVHDSEGLNVQVYNRCIGTRFCSNNCPYKVRRFNFLKYADDTQESLKAQRNPEVTVRRRGVMEKCTYCLQRITRARIEAEKQGRRIADGEVVTACQAACPTTAIHFGDLNDPRSDVAAAKASPLDYALLDELNTRPRTSYTAHVLAPEGEPE